AAGRHRAGVARSSRDPRVSRDDRGPAVKALLLLLARARLGQANERGVVLWHAYTGLERTALETTAAQWNTAHPDNQVVLVAVPYDSFADKLTSASPRGNRT